MFDITTLKFVQFAAVIFSAILFLQSGLNKVFEFRENRDYIQSFLSKTFLSPVSLLLFITITILEVATGVISVIGVFFYLQKNDKSFAILGLELGLLSILCLFLGQRIAKDYGGAASMVGYFIAIAFGLYLFTI
jgi:putative oxidoreductase